LRPSHVQRTITHEFIIDGILFPEVRDKMILYKGSYDLADAVHTLFTTSIIHTDDLLTHSNWEVSEEWFVKFGLVQTISFALSSLFFPFPFGFLQGETRLTNGSTRYLATRSMLEATNKWRRERGEAEIPISVVEDENSNFDP